MEHFLPALLIFALRITDVSIGTLRMLYAMRGNRRLAAGLGLVESGAFIFAIGSALSGASSDPYKMIGYAAGFATGTFLGMTLEGWIASGTVLARIISRKHSHELAAALRAEGFGLTVVHGEGREQDVLILFVVTARKRAEALMSSVRKVDEHAFMTIETVNEARGGYVPHVTPATTFRK